MECTLDILVRLHPRRLTRIIHGQCRPDQTNAINAGTAFANQSCDHQQSVKYGKSRLCSSGTGLREFAPAYLNNPGLTLGLALCQWTKVWQLKRKERRRPLPARPSGLLIESSVDEFSFNGKPQATVTAWADACGLPLNDSINRPLASVEASWGPEK